MMRRSKKLVLILILIIDTVCSAAPRFLISLIDCLDIVYFIHNEWARSIILK